MLYPGDPSGGRLVGINSKKTSESKLSSYLGELQAVVRTLKDVKNRVRGRIFFLHTDSNSVFQRLTKTQERNSLRM